MKYIFLFLFFSMSLFAEESPTISLLKDHPFTGGTFSVEAAPFIPKGVFFFYPVANNDVIADLIFEIKATLKGEVNSEILKSWAVKGSNESGKLTYKATVPFTQTGRWEVEIKAKNKQNGNILTTLTLPVEVTLPGEKPTSPYLYALPFILAGFIVVRVIIRKRKKSTRPS